MSGNQNNNKNNSESPGPSIINVIIIGLLITFLLNTFSSSLTSRLRVQVKYSQFLQLVDAGLIENVQIGSEQISFRLKSGANTNKASEILGTDTQMQGSDGQDLQTEKIYYTGVMTDSSLIDRLYENDISFSPQISTANNPIVNFIAGWVLPIIFFYAIISFFMNRMTKKMGGGSGGGMFGGMMNVGKSNAKLYNVEKKTGITFADVAGQEEAKESLTEIVDFLHHPEIYSKIGAKQPKGALLVGPPGTGKTLLAKAVAGEAKVPFFSLSGSEFVEMFVGVGASRVRDLFQQANKSAPCIIFIDEIDAIGKSRDSRLGGNDEREQTLNQLLAEMDGFDSSKGIIILAATNRPEILDKALLRPGRFDRRIIVEKPDLPGREAILKVHAAKVKMNSKVNLRQIALATSGASGADLANMINEGALRAVRLGRNEVLQEDLMEAVELVVAGKEKKDRVLSPKEKRMVAFHEIGHALSAALQKDSQPVQKITIVPRTTGALGFVVQMPEEERYLMTKNEMLAQIVTLLSGRAAEELSFGESTTGASNDIERATKLARGMVAQYGMSEKIGLMNLESPENQYLDGRLVANCSDTTSAELDVEVRRILDESYRKALDLLNSNREKLNNIAEFLIEKETITGEQFMEILKRE